MKSVLLCAALSFVVWTAPARAEELCIGPACVGSVSTVTVTGSAVNTATVMKIGWSAVNTATVTKVGWSAVNTATVTKVVTKVGWSAMNTATVTKVGWSAMNTATVTKVGRSADPAISIPFGTCFQGRDGRDQAFVR